MKISRILRSYRTRICEVGVIFLVSSGPTVFSQTQTAGTNQWTKPRSGSWDEPYWSLGVLPTNSQSVLIANPGWKAVAVNPSTPINFPDSMTVGSLAIRGAWDTYNTLLLNFAGTEVPLTVLSGLTVADNAQIASFSSALVVEGGMIVITNAQIVQDGGYVRTTNAVMYLQNAAYYLTNGVFEAGALGIGTPGAGRFNQYGGTAVIANLSFGPNFWAGSDSNGYALYGGTLELPGGLRLISSLGSVSFFQSGGTNRTPTVMMEPGYLGTTPRITLNGGLFADGDTDMVGDNYGGAIFEQNGGAHIVTNTLHIAGGANHAAPREAVYYLNGGTLSARLIDLDGHPGDAVFVQTNGFVQAERISAQGYWIFGTQLTLAGGTLACSNLFSTEGGNVGQSGGLLIASNLFCVAGYRDPGFKIYSRYTLMGGTLIASNIILDGAWVIGDSSGTNRIINRGTCSLSHMLQIGNAVEQLGRFILVGDATINLAGTASRLSFLNSRGETWGSTATLTVSNWNGDFSGGGAEQLRFGSNSQGLTPDQLARIRFLDPVGLPEGTYPAVILATGEVVPGSRPLLNATASSNGMVIFWRGNYQLFTSTNVVGPYSTINGAASPYTNLFNDPVRFFILRSP